MRIQLTATAKTVLGLCFACQVSSLAAQAVMDDPAISEDSQDIRRSNDELPKILYLIPWQEAEAAGLETQKLKLFSLEQDVLQPLILMEHQLRDLHQQLHPDDALLE